MTDQNSGATPPPPPSGDPYAVPASTPYAESQPYTGASTAPKSPILSILSLIAGGLGVLGGFAIFWIPFVGPFLQLWFPAAAVVLGFIGKRKEPQAKGLWLTGIITGFVGLLLFVIGIIITIVAVAFINTGDYSDFETY